MFSIKISAPSTSSSSFALPSPLLRSSTTDRLLRFQTMKDALSLSMKGGMRRASSPPSGRSTLTTSAPWSASIIAA
jgi:hypothetical protein